MHFILYKSPGLMFILKMSVFVFTQVLIFLKMSLSVEGHPKGSYLLEPWVQITNVFG